MYSCKCIFWQTFSTEEGKYYARVSILVQERTTTQKRQSQEKGALNFLKSLEKGMKNVSVRKTCTDTCCLASKMYFKFSKTDGNRWKFQFYASSHFTRIKQEHQMLFSHVPSLVLFNLYRKPYGCSVENCECLKLTVTVSEVRRQLFTKYVTTETEFVFRPLLYKPVI